MNVHYNNAPDDGPPSRPPSTEIAAILLGAGFLGSFLLAGYYIVILLYVNQQVIPTLPKTEISYGPSIVISLPVSMLSGFLVGCGCMTYFYLRRGWVSVFSFLLVAIIAYMQLENWRDFGFGKDRTIEAFVYFPDVVVSFTALLTLSTAWVAGAIYYCSRRTPE